VSFYASFFRALIERSIPQEYKVHLIKSLKELTVSDLALLRKIYITSRHDFVNRKGKSELTRSIVETQDPIEASSVQTLIRLGFITSTQTSEKGPVIELTGLIETMVAALYTKAGPRGDRGKGVEGHRSRVCHGARRGEIRALNNGPRERPEGA
jgi:hypothetical protein